MVSSSPREHSNSIEASEEDMGREEGSAAWAPTMLNADEGNAFFFETWRDANGKWWKGGG